MAESFGVRIKTWTAIVLWCLAYVFTKIGLDYFDEVTLSVLRYLAAGAATVLTMVVTKTGLPRLRDLPALAALSLSGFFLNVLTYNAGAGGVTVATASVILAATPLVTVLGACLFFKEKTTPLQRIALVIAFAGTAVVCLSDGVLNMNSSVIWILLSMVCFTVYNLLERFLKLPYTTVQRTQYSLLITAILFLFFIPSVKERTQAFPLPGLLCAVFLGVVCSGIGFLFWNQALKKAKNTADVTNTLFTEPLITSIMGWMFFRELPGIGTIIGGVVILAGLILFERWKG